MAAIYVLCSPDGLYTHLNTKTCTVEYRPEIILRTSVDKSVALLYIYKMTENTYLNNVLVFGLIETRPRRLIAPYTAFRSINLHQLTHGRYFVDNVGQPTHLTCIEGFDRAYTQSACTIIGDALYVCRTQNMSDAYDDRNQCSICIKE